MVKEVQKVFVNLERMVGASVSSRHLMSGVEILIEVLAVQLLLRMLSVLHLFFAVHYFYHHQRVNQNQWE